MERIKLVHGGGGQATDRLIREVFAQNFGSNMIYDMEDAAAFEIEAACGRIAFTTDSFVVKPLFFPGGDIGRLSVCGTVNDLVMRGARPLYLSAAFIIEEGFEVDQLELIVCSMAAACREAGVWIAAGDTKVVEKGAADGIYITTSGVGVVPRGVDVSIKNARPGNAVIISGTIGDHGMAIMAEREGFDFKVAVKSDTAPLVKMVEGLLSLKSSVRVLKDPTRGGVAEALNEIALQSRVGIEIYEDKLPVNPAVVAACGMLGLDFMELANEGKLIAVVAAERAKEALEIIRKSPYGENAEIIGRVNDSGWVSLKTSFGTSRVISRPVGEMLPRIC